MELAAGLVTLTTAPHVPGRTPRPDDAVFAPLKASIPAAASVADLASGIAFAAGFEALEAGYYWEAHEIWEPVWMRLPPASRERHLLQGLIQLANAALKHRMGKTIAFRRILGLADHELAEAFRAHDGLLMGKDRDYIASLRQAIARQ
ncbi:DUF309 domain-containing protein [Pararhodobacter sp.]|uniref:DUF309 domain-containing protein n=1 Tax=Pararhodobacter sp. TaxID=2127056 RepID=UPI002AFE93C6|nr:DUF309 domain-containing protein [Pararhodobacter sp.]